MIERLIQLIRYLKKNIKKVITLLISFLIFLFVLFPINDLSDLVSVQISKATQNSIYLQFERMNLSLFPTPGITVEEVYIETAQTPPINAKEVTISPSPRGLLSQKPYGHFSASGMLGGDLDIWLGQGAPKEGGGERHKLELKAKNIDLLSLRNFMDLPVLVKGQMNLESEVTADVTLAEQPDGGIQLNMQKIEVPPANVSTEMGPLSLPDLKMSQLTIKGRLSNGKFLIEEGILGKETDELSGKIKGELGLRVAPGPSGGLGPELGAYAIDLDFKVKKSFQEKAALFLGFLDMGKTPTADGATYKIKIAAPNAMVPPSITGIK